MGRTLIDDRYRLHSLLGSGGMAEVFLAHDEVLGRDIALKVLKERYAEDEEFVERFRREARSAAALRSPYIVPIFDRGETEDGTYYIAMEHVPGGTLKDRIQSTGPLPPRAAVTLALQTAEALHVAHQRAVIHRDVKPDNILFVDPEHVKVADFGIARAAEATTISHPGDILGSVRYMSPEQAAGERVGPASDLYSLGVIIYEMLTGAMPFAVDTPADVLARHAGDPPRRPSEANPEVPKGLDSVVARLLAKDPEDRYESAAHVVEELRRVRGELPPETRSPEDATTAAMAPPPAQTAPRPEPDGPGRRGGLVWIPIALIVVLGALTWSLSPNGRAGNLPEIVRGVLEGAPDRVQRKPPGQEEVRVPDVEDLTERVARERLADAGFETESRLRASPTEEYAGRVLEQSVSGGQRTQRGSKILLTVGEGPQATRVPDLVGLGYAEAESELEESGYLLGGVREEPSSTTPAGVIIGQDPPAETPLEPGSYVYLTTSVGPSVGSGESAD